MSEVALREETMILPVDEQESQVMDSSPEAEEQGVESHSPLRMNPDRLAQAEAEAAEYTAMLYAEQAALRARLAELGPEINAAHDREKFLEVIRHAQGIHRGSTQRALGSTAASAPGSELVPLSSTGQLVAIRGNGHALQEQPALERLGATPPAVREENVTDATEVANEIARLFRESASLEREAAEAIATVAELRSKEGDDEETPAKIKFLEEVIGTRTSRAAQLREMGRTVRRRRSFPRAKIIDGEDVDLLTDTLAGLRRL